MTALDPITEATHRWAAEKVGCDPENVRTVRFDTIDHGGCPTCAYTTVGVHVVLKRGGFPLEHDMNYESMADVVREITALVTR